MSRFISMEEFDRHWRPLAVKRLWSRRPTAGDVVAVDHGVWRIVELLDDDMTEAETQEWIGYGMPELQENGYRARPYRMTSEHIGGALPPAFKGRKGIGTVRVGYGDSRTWDVYPTGRWPQCSCCGEPMPCQAEMNDRLVERQVEKVEKMASRMPGCCWGCGDPISNRQQSIRYVGANVDLPGGPPVVFHLRKSCRYFASQYELRWLPTDPTHRRILTYPKCGGHLYSHADGTTECAGENRDPECIGHESHDHGSQSGCRFLDDGCPRGCPVDSSYVRMGKRPQFRDPELPQGRMPHPEAAPARPDGRAVCPGHLLVHRDGTSVCIAGGRDDCWGGDTYRHERKRDCRNQTAGCPKCETTENLA